MDIGFVQFILNTEMFLFYSNKKCTFNELISHSSYDEFSERTISSLLE